MAKSFGQHKNVQVHRFITKYTFEEKIDRMIQEKRHIAEMAVASGRELDWQAVEQEIEGTFS